MTGKAQRWAQPLLLVVEGALCMLHWTITWAQHLIVCGQACNILGSLSTVTPIYLFQRTVLKLTKDKNWRVRRCRLSLGYLQCRLFYPLCVKYLGKTCRADVAVKFFTCLCWQERICNMFDSCTTIPLHPVCQSLFIMVVVEGHTKPISCHLMVESPEI